MKPSPWFLLIVACALLVLGGTLTPSHAQPARTAAPGEAEARKLVREGMTLHGQGKFREAIAVLEKAYAHWKNPKILINIAICHAEMKDKVAAARLLRQAFASLEPDQAAKLRAGLPAIVAKVESEVAVIVVTLPDGSAEVHVDGERIGPAPLTHVTLPGKHVVEIRREGQVIDRQTYILAPGGSVRYTLEAWPAARAEPARPDPRPEPPTPPPARPRSKLGRLPIYYFAAAVIVAVVTGAALIGTGVKTEQIQDDYYAAPSLSTRDRGLRYRTTTNALLAVSALSAAGAVVLGVLTDWRNPLRRKERSVSVTPSVAPTGAGLLVQGRF